MSNVGVVAAMLALAAGGLPLHAQTRVELRYPESAAAGPIEGRAFLIVSRERPTVDLLRISYGAGRHPLFGVDVHDLAPGEPVVIDAETPGYPLARFGELPPDDYYVQGLLVPYTRLERADGHVVAFPLDRGEGQRWKIQPGSLHSAVQRMRIDAAGGGTIRIELGEREPELAPIADTRYVRHERIRSELLSRFWGRDMHVGAYVLLPAGFDEQDTVRYPVAYFITNFQRDFENYIGFREQRNPRATGWERIFDDEAHAFYREWTSGTLPPMLVIVIQSSTPFYRGSFGINSENAGPYGDALIHELLPYLEQRYRAIGEGWARTLYGTGTGAWHALAWQILQPRMFNGVWSFGPDPIDFRAFNLVNIYEDANAFHADHPYRTEPVRPYERETNGDTHRTVRQQSRLEAVFGSRGRNAEDLNASSAAFGPVAADGYPRMLWDPISGVIDREVAEHWRRYDLRYLLERDWGVNGTDLVGKIHIRVRDPDPYFREVGVRLMESFLESTTAPYYAGSIEYVDRAGGESDVPERLGRLRATRTALTETIARLRATAPSSFRLAGW
jgi:enterochelin esterase-like enzyme